VKRKGQLNPRGLKAKVTRKRIKTKSKQKPKRSIEILVSGSSRLQWLSQGGQTDIDRNREGDEAVPAAISDVENIPKVEE
jgi:hypothetical protein